MRSKGRGQGGGIERWARGGRAGLAGRHEGEYLSPLDARLSGRGQGYVIELLCLGGPLALLGLGGREFLTCFGGASSRQNLGAWLSNS